MAIGLKIWLWSFGTVLLAVFASTLAWACETCRGAVQAGIWRSWPEGLAITAAPFLAMALLAFLGQTLLTRHARRDRRP